MARRSRRSRRSQPEAIQVKIADTPLSNGLQPSAETRDRRLKAPQRTGKRATAQSQGRIDRTIRHVRGGTGRGCPVAQRWRHGQRRRGSALWFESGPFCREKSREDIGCWVGGGESWITLEPRVTGRLPEIFSLYQTLPCLDRASRPALAPCYRASRRLKGPASTLLGSEQLTTDDLGRHWRRRT